MKLGILGCGHVGDEDLATLYVTSAARGTRGEPLAGSLVACRPGIRGLGATPFAG